jgi:putative hydrolase of HD superfamily
MQLTNAIEMCQIILRFGQVMRITEDSNGRKESDTTHSVMLALIAGELSVKETVQLDREAVISLALIHDLAEVYAGDTPTLRELTSAEKAFKDRKEADSIDLLKRELAAFPWVIGLLERYERQLCPESRFVRCVDKIMPKLTHIENGCKVPQRFGMTHKELVERHQQQSADLQAKYPEFELTHRLMAKACKEAELIWVPLEVANGQQLP